MSTSASSVETGGVVLPAYLPVTGAMVRTLEQAAAIAAGDSEDEGEQFQWGAQPSPSTVTQHCMQRSSTAAQHWLQVSLHNSDSTTL